VLTRRTLFAIAAALSLSSGITARCLAGTLQVRIDHSFIITDNDANDSNPNLWQITYSNGNFPDFHVDTLHAQTQPLDECGGQRLLTLDVTGLRTTWEGGYRTLDAEAADSNLYEAPFGPLIPLELAAIMPEAPWNSTEPFTLMGSTIYDLNPLNHGSCDPYTPPIVIDPFFDPPPAQFDPTPVPLPSAVWGGLVLLGAMALRRLIRSSRPAPQP
jgi:hypothetical protein